nr:DUF190 domain-containing protein [uncultured Pedobacter sp.]
MNSQIKEAPVGKIKIYVTAKEKVKAKNLLGKIRGRQTYREILQQAKHEQLMSALLYHTHGGFLQNEKMVISNTETDNAQTVICVELVDTKERLENFCQKNHLLLEGKIIIFKSVVLWTIAK